MNYFLVDYENVNVSGFVGIENLTENDALIIFYSNNANTMTFGLHLSLTKTRANLQIHKVEVNKKNSLDFQLCSYLGYLICDTMCKPDENSKNYYYIVSNDLEFVILSDFWKKRGVEVTVVKNLTKIPTVAQSNALVIVTPAKTPTPQPSGDLERALATVLKNQQEISEAAKIVRSAKTKVDAHNLLVKKFGTRSGEIYQAVKNFMA